MTATQHHYAYDPRADVHLVIETAPDGTRKFAKRRDPIDAWGRTDDMSAAEFGRLRGLFLGHYLADVQLMTGEVTRDDLLAAVAKCDEALGPEFPTLRAVAS